MIGRLVRLNIPSCRIFTGTDYLAVQESCVQIIFFMYVSRAPVLKAKLLILFKNSLDWSSNGPDSLRQSNNIFNLFGYCLLPSEDFNAYMNRYNGLCCCFILFLSPSFVIDSNFSTFYYKSGW